MADRLAAEGIPALAMPFFARTAPAPELGYSDADLALGRQHKDATTAVQILSDVSAAIGWLRARYSEAAVGVVGFCFGGHAALLAATLPEVDTSIDFYGAGVSWMCPGSGPLSLTRLPQVKGRLIALCDMAHPLITQEERAAIQAAFNEQDPKAQRMRCLTVEEPTMASCVRHGGIFIPKLLPRDGRFCWMRWVRSAFAARGHLRGCRPWRCGDSAHRFGFRRFLFFLLHQRCFAWCEEHDHVAAFPLGSLLDFSFFLEILGHAH